MIRCEHPLGLLEMLPRYGPWVGDSFRTPAPSDSIEIASEMPATLSPSRTQRLDT